MVVKKYIDKILDTLLLSILGLMAVVMAANVFSRFFLNASLYWGDELALVLFVWLTFLGSAVAIRERSHYVLNYFTNKLSGNRLFYYNMTGDVLTTIAISVLLFYSAKVAVQINVWIMPALEISRTLVYGAAPAGCLLMLYYMILRMVTLIQSGRNENHP